jgi:hypothetical protein
MIEEFAALVDESVRSRCSKVFYSGRVAFGRPAQLYILGFNPGGDPAIHAEETVSGHTDRVLQEFDDLWSEYSDASWLNQPPGTAKLQRRVLHMLERLDLNPRGVPASNLIFVRSSRAGNIKDQMSDLAQQCWPVHAAVVKALKPIAILCLGTEVGKYVRLRLKARSEPVDYFVEQNKRGWRSEAHLCENGQAIITVAHPAIADWTSPATDPTSLVRRVIRRTVSTSKEKPAQMGLRSKQWRLAPRIACLGRKIQLLD